MINLNDIITTAIWIGLTFVIGDVNFIATIVFDTIVSILG
jgi:hypothetical protein